MLSWIIQMSIISIVFIFLIHHLLSFFKTTLTVPKVKDLVNSPSQKYQRRSLVWQCYASGRAYYLLRLGADSLHRARQPDPYPLSPAILRADSRNDPYRI